jgi:hypothetical protein
LPGLPPRLWYRLVALLWWRGEHTHPALKRMLKHLARHADQHGVLTDVPGILASYSGRHAVGARTGWYDFARACEAGLVRQLHAAAPERQARYILALDVAALPADLPADLRAAVRRYVDNPAAVAKGAQTRASVHRSLSECQVVRYGSARRAPIMDAAGCGRLHTSPFTREGSPPSPQPRESHQSQRPRRLPFQGQDLSEERSRALDFVKGLCPVWASQRRSGDVPSDDELAGLTPLVALLLRRMAPSELAELLSAQVASAVDLAGVLRWRIGRVLGGLRRAERRASRLRVDEDGARHAAWLAANAAAAPQQAAAKAAVVELARRRAAEIAATQAPGVPPRPTAPLRPLTEPEEIFRREVERHALPAAPRWASEPEEVLQHELQPHHPGEAAAQSGAPAPQIRPGAIGAGAGRITPQRPPTAASGPERGAPPVRGDAGPGQVLQQREPAGYVEARPAAAATTKPGGLPGPVAELPEAYLAARARVASLAGATSSTRRNPRRGDARCPSQRL